MTYYDFQLAQLGIESVSPFSVIALTAGVRFVLVLRLMNTGNATVNSSSFVILKHVMLPLRAK